MALIGKIRGMRLRDGKSISEISRLTSLSRNTIKKWLKTSQGAAPSRRLAANAARPDACLLKLDLIDVAWRMG
jgi:transposase-like protein